MFRAKLDANNVYQGIEEVAALTETDVEVPNDCDLAIGQYVYMNSTFVPLIALKAAEK